MSFVAVDQLVRRGHLSEAQAPRVEWLWDEIRRLKRDKRAFIPAHNYQVPEVQAIADLVGDSFELAVKARDLPAEQGALVVFCGVRFMAEGCHTLAPARPVYLPNLGALCSLAEVDADDVAERQEFLRAAGRRFATMTYVNTYADVKALSDTCCTSSNAARIAEKLGLPDILFVPDQNLAYQVALKTQRTYLPPPEPHKFHPREYAEMIEPLIREGEKQGLRGNVFAWEGACHVHHQMNVEDIARIRKDDPGATVIVHGEVRPELQRAADAVLSTSQMAKYVDAHPEQTRYAILTECGLVVRLELDHPEKQFYKPCRLCRYMKAIDLESVYRTLRDEPADQRITVPDEVRAGAARAMLKMIELAA
ncbi:MAG TPA: quinolinate synthase [Polyangia bacterium]|jgi:quinolinate synthase|nr:quinolinate synthase [Polyangia bacterium]